MVLRLVRITHPYSPEKILAHRDRLELVQGGHQAPPVTVDLDLTDACDHHCPWCEYSRFRQRGPANLSPEVVLTLLDCLKDSPVKGIIFSGGGEPTLYPSFRQVLARTRENGLKAALFTHGAHIHRYAREISQTFSYVRVSLDAGSALTHSRLHTGGNVKAFGETLDDLNLLKRLNPSMRTGISVLLCEESSNELGTLARILSSVQVDFLLVKFSRFQPDNTWLTPDKLARIQEQVGLLEHQLPVYYRPPNPEEWGGYPLRRCRTHFLKTLVAPDGNVYVCNQRRGDPSMKLGSLYDRGFWSIWHSGHHALIARQIDTSRCPPCRHVAYNRLADELKAPPLLVLEYGQGVEDLAVFL